MRLISSLLWLSPTRFAARHLLTVRDSGLLGHAPLLLAMAAVLSPDGRPVIDTATTSSGGGPLKGCITQRVLQHACAPQVARSRIGGPADAGARCTLGGAGAATAGRGLRDPAPALGAARCWGVAAAAAAAAAAAICGACACGGGTGSPTCQAFHGLASLQRAPLRQRLLEPPQTWALSRWRRLKFVSEYSPKHPMQVTHRPRPWLWPLGSNLYQKRGLAIGRATHRHAAGQLLSKSWHRGVQVPAR